MKRARFRASLDMQPPSLATACQGSMSLRLRLAAGALALPVIGDEEADKLNNLLGNRSQDQGLNRCVAWSATAKRVDRMKRRGALLRVPGHAEACPSAEARPHGLKLRCGWRSTRVLMHHAKIIPVPRRRNTFARTIRPRLIHTRRDSLLAQLADVPILCVRHVPEFDRVIGFEIGSIERVRMK